MKRGFRDQRPTKVILDGVPRSLERALQPDLAASYLGPEPDEANISPFGANPPSIQKLMEINSRLKSQMAPPPDDASRPVSAGQQKTPSRLFHHPSESRSGTKQTDKDRIKASYSDLKVSYDSLQARFESLQKENDELRDGIRHRQETYAMRERALEQDIMVLKQQLDEAVLARMDESQRMESLRFINRKIQSEIDTIQGTAARMLKDQKDELQRSFKARLLATKETLKQHQDKGDGGSKEWIEKTKELVLELEKTQEEAVRLDSWAQELLDENKRLRVQYKAQEDDRMFLVKQAAALKRENARLLGEIDKMQEQLVTASLRSPEVSSPTAAGVVRHAFEDDIRGGRSSRQSMGGGAVGASGSIAADMAAEFADKERRYIENINRLRKLLDAERKNLKNVRQAHISVLNERSELEVFLRQCIEDVRADLNRQRAELRGGPTPGLGSPAMSVASPGGGGGASGITPTARAHSAGYAQSTASSLGKLSKFRIDPFGASLSEFSSADKQRVIELLLSKERVLNLLFEKTFPHKLHSSNHTQSLEKLLAEVDDQSQSADLMMSPAAAAAGGGLPPITSLTDLDKRRWTDGS